ncbi:MAG: polyphosphate polymerase domain-containing protein [Saprospiraceae bacterium]
MRYERKYKMYDYAPSILEQAVKMHPASFKKIYPDRQINNIYFDTSTLSSYWDNVNGVAERKKYRVRWYNFDETKIEKPHFEVKGRINELGTKKIIRIDDFDLDNLRFLTRIVNELSDAPGRLQPIIMNSYHRSYYGTSDGKFRVTIDERIRYFSLMFAQRFTRYTVQDFNAAVLELKYDRNMDDYTDRITQFFPFRQTKSSKYVTGVQYTIY